jgi:hypothetical protein
MWRLLKFIRLRFERPIISLGSLKAGDGQVYETTELGSCRAYVLGCRIPMMLARLLV